MSHVHDPQASVFLAVRSNIYRSPYSKHLSAILLTGGGGPERARLTDVRPVYRRFLRARMGKGVAHTRP